MSAFRERLSCLLVATAATLLIGVVDASAQRIEIVHAFPASPQVASGKLLELRPGVFIGTSYAGGAYGQGSVYLMYRRSDATWATYTLHSFYDVAGRHPAAGVIRASDGNFYGTTVHGGINNQGTIFRLTPSLKFTTVHVFTGLDGAEPNASLVQVADGSLWGTAARGGSGNNYGSVFRMTLAGQFAKVHTFDTQIDGSSPGQLILSSADGHLYGTTRMRCSMVGGMTSCGGTVFRLTQAGLLSTLHTFNEADLYQTPRLTEGVDGHLYGLDNGSALGRAFRLTRNGAFTKLHDFEALVDGPGRVTGSLVQAPDGFMYGVTNGYLEGDTYVPGGGAVYRMSLEGAVQRVAVLAAARFGGPPTDLILASDGGLYGTTSHGQRPQEFVDANSGVMFTLPVSGPATMLYDYATAAPRLPLGRLVEGPDGKLYGTSCAGGRYDRGTVFRLDGSATTTLHSFTGGDGVCPASGLAVGSDGAFYGTALGGFAPPTSGGTIYRITADGSLATLWSRNSDDGVRFPQAAPSEGPDGRLYVPVGDLAAIMRIEADSTVTHFADVPNGSQHEDGQWMTGPLLLANDGNFYATTSTDPGSVSRLSLDGTFAPVHRFPLESETPRANRRSGLIQASDGRLYGVAQRGGRLDAGIVYSIGLSGSLSVLHEFSYADGNAPSGELIEISPGRFVGVTTGAVDARYKLFGTIFEVTSAGGFQTVHRFSWWDGAGPFTGLTRTSSGEIYGTTMAGGPLGGGVIFRLVPSESQK